MRRNADSYDALVVGARAAGAATAMLMARAGMRVLVVDWEEHGSDTLSTHALMRSATMQLSRWGLADKLRSAGTPDVTETLFCYAGEEVHVPIRPAYGIPGLLAPRRWLLDAVLADAAWTAGAEIRYRTAFQDVIWEHGRVAGAIVSDADGRRSEIRAELVIGADGRRSSVARRVGAVVYREAPCSVASVYGYVEGIENRGYRWYYAPGLGAGLIPTNDGAHCVFAADTPAGFVRGFAVTVRGPVFWPCATQLTRGLGHWSGPRVRCPSRSSSAVCPGFSGTLRALAGRLSAMRATSRIR